MADPGVDLPLEAAQASALAPQSSPPPPPDLEGVVFGVDGLEEAFHEFQSSEAVALVFGGSLETPQSSPAEEAGAARFALGVPLPRGLPLEAPPLDPQSSPALDPLDREVVLPPLEFAAKASAFSPQSLDGSVLAGLEFGVVFAAARVDVVEAQALVAAFQSSGSLLAGAADREVLLDPLLVVDAQASAAAPHSDASVAGFLDDPLYGFKTRKSEPIIVHEF